LDKNSISSLYESQERKIDIVVTSADDISQTKTLKLQSHNQLLKQVNHVYQTSGNFVYFIDDCFAQDDLILPV
jgi:hypothetical protein